MSIDILVLCTGNICRSPMAEAFLRERLEARGVAATVHSAGLLNNGAPANEHGVVVMGGFGLDLSSHRSRLLTAGMIQGADLVLGMARDHVRQAVVLVPEAWQRAFTIKELVRRGRDVGPRKPNETVQEWLARAHAGREHGDLLGQGTDDDVFDPIGYPRSHFKACAVELKGLVGTLVDLVHPPAGAPTPASSPGRGPNPAGAVVHPEELHREEER